MFAPDIHTTKEQLTTLYNEITGISGYSTGIRDTLIGTLPREPDWIPAVRSEMKILSQAGADWFTKFPDDWSDILTTFIDYGTAFEAFSDQITNNINQLTPNQIVELLTQLSKSLASCADRTKNSLDKITALESHFTNVFPTLNESINAGWKELDKEEAEMVAIAEAITQLQADISSLESKIDAAGISGGKTFVQTNVKIAYSIITATGEVAIPYLSIAVLAYTVGKTLYDIISGTDKIEKDLRKLTELQVQATEEAQAAAATKATIQYLYQIEIQFLSFKKHGDELWIMWKNQKSFVDQAIDAINAGVDPSRFLDLLTMKVAAQNWNVLLQFANQIMKLTPQIGPDVILKTVKPNISQ